MTDASLRERLDGLVTDEPPLRLHLGEVVADGRRRRRRHHVARGLVGAVSLSAVAAATAIPLALTSHHNTQQTLSIRPFAVTGAQLPAVSEDAGLTGDQQRVADAIRAASPAGWTFDMSSDRWDGLGVEATADDGTGPGRLMIGFSKAGYQLVHPCNDSEFRAGASCVERTLEDGSVLSLRGLIDYHGIQYIDVVLTHPDGSGVMAEAGNFTIDWPPPQVVTPEQKKHLEHVTRSDPTYSVDQLAKVVVQVDHVIR